MAMVKASRHRSKTATSNLLPVVPVSLLSCLPETGLLPAGFSPDSDFAPVSGAVVARLHCVGSGCFKPPFL